MKIHIVQKGDTLWEISKQYGVDFEELKRLNSQLSNPEMIMPGMKIKIPGQTKHVKSEQNHHGGGGHQHHAKNQMVPPKGQMTPPPKAMPAKEQPHMMPPKGQMTPQKAKPAKEKPMVEQPPLKAMPTVPAPIIQPDDIKPIEPVQPEMPIYQAPQMPKIEFDMIQNQVFQQSQQAPQAPVMTPPMAEQPQAPVAQPTIQILPVYFYPIMQPAMPPQQHHNPCTPCGPMPMQSPCEPYPSMQHMQPMPYQEQFVNYEPMMHGHGYEPMMSNCMSTGCEREEQLNDEDQANGMPLHAEEREQETNHEQQEELNAPGSYYEHAGQPPASAQHTYYEPAPRYFDSHNFYSPHQQAPFASNEQANDAGLNQANPIRDQRQEPNQF